MEALERSGQALGRVHAVFANLYGTDASEALDAVATDITPKLAAHSDSVYQNADLYARIQAVTPPPGARKVPVCMRTCFALFAAAVRTFPLMLRRSLSPSTSACLC